MFSSLANRTTMNGPAQRETDASLNRKIQENYMTLLLEMLSKC